jgi:hypothetical protein
MNRKSPAARRGAVLLLLLVAATTDTTALTTTTTAAGNCTIIPDVTVSSADLHFYSGPFPASSCCALCQSSSLGCHAFTVNSSGCALKASSAGAVPSKGATSGITGAGPGPTPAPPTAKCTGQSADLAAEDCVAYQKFYDMCPLCSTMISETCRTDPCGKGCGDLICSNTEGGLYIVQL